MISARFSIKKRLINVFIAVAVAAAMPVSVFAEVIVYGRAHVSVDRLDDGVDYSEVVMSSNSSRLGFKTEKLTDSGITGIMQIEAGITYNQGDSRLSSRNTFAGLKGDYGMLRLGQFDTPFKSARGPANLFGEQVGDLRNLARVSDGSFDERTPNTIHYQSTNLNGFYFNLAYSLHEGNYANYSVDPATDKQDLKNAAVSTSLTYRKNAFDAALAYAAFNEDAAKGKRNAFRFAGAYQIHEAIKLVSFLQTVDHDNDANDSDVLGFGAQYKITKDTSIKGMVMNRIADPDNSDSSLVALGVERYLDKALLVYLNYAMIDNDNNVALVPWVQGRTTSVAGAVSETASAVSLGLRFDF